LSGLLLFPGGGVFHYTMRNLMTSKFALGFVLLFAAGAVSPAAVIGTNTPSQPLTLERIATLPAAQRPAWKDYLKRSDRQQKADADFLRSEMKKFGLKQATNTPASRSSRSVPMGREEAWYGGSEARQIADIVVSFQTPAGGWSKQINMTQRARQPGELFASASGSRFLTVTDYDRLPGGDWNYGGTFDNEATIAQLRFLAKVGVAQPAGQGDKYRAAFMRGLDYIFNAQYPNGGWPQVWPLQGGYHDGITYNDNAMANVLRLLSEVAEGRGGFAFVSKKTRTHAAASLKRGIDCILATQIVEDGRRTVWCQQHDALTLKPTSARNYEMPCKTSSESAGILQLLMSLPNPDPKVIAAVHAAAAWFEKTKLNDVAFRNPGDGNGRQLLPAPGNGPIWARYYDLATDRPIFGDRDKSVHDDVNKISRERRGGYAWFVDRPKLVLEAYERWSKEHPLRAK
jgi:PelA/Pel-15E family pectate lyase